MRPKNFNHFNLYAIILAGGRGKRLRPLSTASRPKVFLSVMRDGRTMFRSTFDRVAKIVGPEHIIVVANKAHEELVKMDAPKASHKNIIFEPASRNTAPAIAVAARSIIRMNKNAVMLVMPADHYVDDKRGEIKNLKRGIEFVIDNDEAIVVIGVRPECASSEYGYVKIVKSAAIAKAERFFEKPDIKTARRYYASGAYLWNSGIFIFKARTFMTSLQRYAPKIFSESAHENISKSYERMPDISIDYAVMEKADNIYCLKGSYGWSDIGSFQALERVLNRESRTFVKRGGKIVKIHPAPSK